MKFNYTIDLDNTYSDSKIWISSDFHLGHCNVLGYSKRPYKTVEENIEDVLNKINSKVTEKDFLIILGDNVWIGQASRIYNFFRKIPTNKIILLYGNHDREKNYKQVIEDELILSAGRLEHLRIRKNGEEQEVALCHYPLLSWNGKARGAIMLHGHCHGNIDEFNEMSPDLRVDVGWDSKLKKFDLIEYSEIIEYFKKKTNGLSFRDYVKSMKIID